MWSAHVSKALLSKYEQAGLYEPLPNAALRVYGEEALTLDEMTDRIHSVAGDIGLDEAHVVFNMSIFYPQPIRARKGSPLWP